MSKNIRILLMILFVLFFSSSTYADVTDRKVATWNMQGSSASNENKWQIYVRSLITGRGSVDIVALQEAGGLPTTATQSNGAIVPVINPDGIPNQIEQRLWNLGTSTRPDYVYIYFLVTLQRVSLAVVTRNRPDAVIVHANPREGISNTARPVIGIRYGTDVYYSMHALARGDSNEAAEQVAHIHTYYRYLPMGSTYQWMIMGDYNRSPGSFTTALANYNPDAARNVTVAYQNSQTQQSGHNLDYAAIGQVGSSMSVAVSTVLFLAQLAGQMASDHTPVLFSRSH